MKILSVLFSIIILLSLNACKENNNQLTENINLETGKDRISYAVGADYGVNLLSMPEEVLLILDKSKIAEGFEMGMQELENNDFDNCDEEINALFSKATLDSNDIDVDYVSTCYGFAYGEMLRNNLKGKDALEQLDLKFTRIGFEHALNKGDTLIPIEERMKIVTDFNNDIAKLKGEKLIQKAKAIEGAVIDEKGFVLIEKENGNGELVSKEMEYNIVFTMMEPNGDTIISTYIDQQLPETENARIINADDIILPNGWMEATKYMKVGAAYDLYLNHEMAFGENGLFNQRKRSYVVAPFTALKISTKVLEQAPMHTFAKRRGENMLNVAKKRPNTFVAKEGYVVETIQKGEGPKIAKGSDVKAHYILKNADGDVIQNSYEMSGVNNPPVFSLNSVIPGWQMGVTNMQKGGKYVLYLPYNLGYGEMGSNNIPPYEALIFEMEIVDFGAANTLTR